MRCVRFESDCKVALSKAVNALRANWLQMTRFDRSSLGYLRSNLTKDIKISAKTGLKALVTGYYFNRNSRSGVIANQMMAISILS
jgi:hypothetical protein